MDLQRACDILELSIEQVTMQSVKKSYFKMALLWHPDKNKTTEASHKFNEIHDAYSFMCEYISVPESSEEISRDYAFILSKFIKNTFGITIDTYKITIIMNDLKHGYIEAAIKTFESLDREVAENIYKYLQRYYLLFGLSIESLDRLSNILDRNIITLVPSIDNILNHDIYILDHKGDKYHIPLWHNELEYDNIIVHISPITPRNISIDEFNNIHASIKLSIVNIFTLSTYSVYIGSRLFEINIRELYIKPNQTKCFANQGFAQIDTTNIFSITKQSNVYIHITLGI